MPKTPFLDLLRERVIVGDGAMGTTLYDKGIPFSACFEELNASRPDLVLGIHREYVEAGAGFLESNTFGANRYRLSAFHLEGRVQELNRLGVQLARKAAGPGAFVAGSVGPLSDPGRHDRPPADERRQAFAEQIGGLLEGGCDAIVLETFSDLEELLLGVEAAKALGAVVVAQLSYLDQGLTSTGVDAIRALRALEAAGADVIGTNCGQGPQGVLRVIERLGQATARPLSAFPNAGFPRYVDGRYRYVSMPDYIAETAERMAAAGANLVGGCCGTGPEEVYAIAKRLKDRAPSARPVRVPAEAAGSAPPETLDRLPGASFASRLGRQLVVVAEVDPPKGLRTERHVVRASRLVKAGVDAITIGDNPLAIQRMGHTAFASLVLRDVKTDIILHLACRDRNLLGMQSELMAAAALGVTSILCLTGDPARVGPQGGASSVFDLDVFGLIRLVKQMNAGVDGAGRSLGLRSDFSIGVSLNPNFRYRDMQVKRLEKKIAAGAHFVMTQPVFTPKGVEAMADAVRHLRVPVLCGVMPVTSARSADYLHGEVPGIIIPDHVRDRLRKAPEGQEAAEGLAVAREILDAAIANGFGVYLVAPFGKIDPVVSLVQYAWERTRAAKPAPPAEKDPEAENEVEE